MDVCRFSHAPVQSPMKCDYSLSICWPHQLDQTWKKSAHKRLSHTHSLAHTHTKMKSKEKSPRRKHGKWGKKCRIMMILVLLFRCKNWSKSTNKQECQSIYCGRYFLLFRFSRGASDLNQPPFTVSHCIWQIVYHVMAQKRPKHLKWTQVHTFLPLFHFFFPHIILSLVRFSASMCRIARLLFPFYFCPFDC